MKDRLYNSQPGMYNKYLSQQIGLIPAALFYQMNNLAYLEDLYAEMHHKTRTKDPIYSFSMQRIEDEIGLSEKEQKAALKKLVKIGLIKILSDKDTNEIAFQIKSEVN